MPDDEPTEVLDALPDLLRPAIMAAADSGASIDVLVDPQAPFAERAAVATAMMQAAVAARTIVPRASYDDLDTQLRQVQGRWDRAALQLADIGERRARAEQLCHLLADALQTGVGADDAVAAYREMQW